jgi:hypothetical protein
MMILKVLGTLSVLHVACVILGFQLIHNIGAHLDFVVNKSH